MTIQLPSEKFNDNTVTIIDGDEVNQTSEVITLTGGGPAAALTAARHVHVRYHQLLRVAHTQHLDFLRG